MRSSVASSIDSYLSDDEDYEVEVYSDYHNDDNDDLKGPVLEQNMKRHEPHVRVILPLENFLEMGDGELMAPEMRARTQQYIPSSDSEDSHGCIGVVESAIQEKLKEKMWARERELEAMRERETDKEEIMSVKSRRVLMKRAKVNMVDLGAKERRPSMSQEVKEWQKMGPQRIMRQGREELGYLREIGQGM